MLSSLNLNITQTGNLPTPRHFQFWDFVLNVAYAEATFAGFVILLLISLYLTKTINLIHKVINLSFMSLIVVLLWVSVLGANLVCMAYILAFVGAVVMLFLGVVMMLPASLVTRQPQIALIVFLPLAVLLYVVALIGPLVTTVALLCLVGTVFEVVVTLVMMLHTLKTMHTDITRQNLGAALLLVYRKQRLFAAQNFPVRLSAQDLGIVIISMYAPALIELKLFAPGFIHSRLRNYLIQGHEAPPTVRWLIQIDAAVALGTLRTARLFNYDMSKPALYSLPPHTFFLPNPFELAQYLSFTPTWLHRMQPDTLLEEVSAFEQEANVLYTVKQSMSVQNRALLVWQFIATALLYGAKAVIARLQLEFRGVILKLLHSRVVDTFLQSVLAAGVFLSALSFAPTARLADTNHLQQALSTSANAQEGLRIVKHYLYEYNPLLLHVSVLILLVALLGAIVLSRKSR